MKIVSNPHRKRNLAVQPREVFISEIHEREGRPAP